MFAVGIRFVAGQRYRATPWDAHVNEGRVEWPPSPWRLLRTVVAAWYLRATGHEKQGPLAPRVMQALVERLAERPPLYLLPRSGVVGFHTRHYFPWHKEKKGKVKTVLVFDACVDLGPPRIAGWLPVDCDGVRVGGSEHAARWHLVALWPEAALPESQLDALGALLGRLNYFGRAESLAQLAAVVPDEPLCARPPWRWTPEEQRDRGVFVASPLEEGPPVPDDPQLEVVRLLAPMSAEDYRAWRQQQAAPEPSRGRSRRHNERGKTGGAAPETLWEALEQETNAWRNAGWPRPPGSRWVAYPSPKPEGAPVRSVRVSSEPLQGRPVVARFAVHGPVPPSLRDAVLETEKLRRKLMGHSRGPDGLPSQVFSGKAPDGTPLQGHRHAFFLAEANEWPRPRGTITHLNIYAPYGFDERATKVLAQRLGKLWGRDGYDLDLILLAIGEPEDLATQGPQDVGRGRSPLFAESEEWVSRTPFVPTMHPKTQRTHGNRQPPQSRTSALPPPGKSKMTGYMLELGSHGDALRLQCSDPGCPCRSLDHDDPRPQQAHPQQGSPEDNVVRLLRAQGLPRPVRIERIRGTRLGGKPVRWLHFRRERKHGGGTRSSSRGFGFRLVFPEPVRGPIALGYGAHFGLGLFVPAWTGWAVPWGPLR